MRQAFRYPRTSLAAAVAECVKALVDFSRFAHEMAAHLNEIVQKHDIFSSIEMLDAFRYGKTNQPLSISIAAFFRRNARRGLYCHDLSRTDIDCDCDERRNLRRFCRAVIDYDYEHEHEHEYWRHRCGTIHYALRPYAPTPREAARCGRVLGSRPRPVATRSAFRRRPRLQRP
jgi:hypothetical protein